MLEYCIFGTHHNFYVKWGNALPAPFRVSNGVRQGGTLLNVYADKLSVLSDGKIGCTINGVCVNHIMYADDTVLIAPSPHALPSLIQVCESYAKHDCIVFNSSKFNIMCIKPRILWLR